MKNYTLFLLVAITASCIGHGQVILGNNTGGTTMFDLNLQNTHGISNRESSVLTDVKGSRFLTKDKQQAKVTIDGLDQIATGYAIIDLYSQVVFFSENPQGVEGSPINRASTININIEGTDYRFVEFGTDQGRVSSYAEIIDKFDTGAMLVRTMKKEVHTTESAGGSSYSSGPVSSFRDVEKIYFVNAEGKGFVMENHKKRVSSSLPADKAAKVDQFVKENKLSFKDDYQALVKVAEYYSTL